jgi:adenine deaminase
MHSCIVSGQVVDIFHRRIFPGVVVVDNGIITSITEVSEAPAHFIMPGFVDAHVHIESSMLVPTAFARLAVVHGTVATVSDPHEIANVNGLAGVQYMIDNSKQTPFKIFFGAPSCVPATFFETAGAVINAADIAKLLNNPDIWYLTEMMNYPGVLHNDPDVMAKIKAAKAIGKPIDGHAPGLRGEDAEQYAAAGITTDHECFTLPEALDKIGAGMSILIREGSAAKNYEALSSLLHTHPDKVMFCSDDKHPDDLVLHHINNIVKRSLSKGYDLFNVLRAASLNPIEHYKLPVGLLRENDPADFIIVNNLQQLDVLQTYINGQLVAEHGRPLLPHVPAQSINNFNVTAKTVADFYISTNTAQPRIRVIEAVDGQLVTNELEYTGKVLNGNIVSNTENDVLKIALVNRYENKPVAVGFIKNFGLKAGALASTVAHDCHNIIAVGVTDEHICNAVNMLIDCQGGVAISGNNEATTAVMPLPISGLMTGEDGYEVAALYAAINEKAKQLGTTLHAPFMTLSFMALLVIPSVKLSDKGLFNGSKFEFVDVVKG